MEESRHEVIIDIMDCYKTAEPKLMRKMLEQLVQSVKIEVMKELNNTIKSIERT